MGAGASARPNGDADQAPLTLKLGTDGVKIVAEPGPKAGDSRSAEPISPAGSLATRRKMMGLQVAVAKAPDSMDRGEKLVDRSEITAVEDIASHYTILGEVMPSTNTGMEVKFATRVCDGAQVVVKIREKATSFISTDEETEWRQSTIMLLNMSHSESIAQIYEVLEDQKNYYVFMEKCEGMDLFELLHSDKVELGYAKAILRQLLEAVQTLHAKGCIHKDLKLENVMVSPPTSPKGSADMSPKWRRKRSTPVDEPEPVVKLIDFDTVEGFTPDHIERAKSVVGTDQYIAQEAYAGKYTPASDIFAVGVIAYRLICGRFPFKEKMFDDKPGENWVGSPKMKVIQQRLNKFTIDWTRPPWSTEPDAKNLTAWMLQNNETDRPTATQCLHHAFLAKTGTTPGLPLKGLW